MILAALTPDPACRREHGLEALYPITTETCTIGRSSTNEIVLNVISVSRTHATLVRCPDGGWTVHNHSRPNPVRVNGNKGDEQPVHSGDRVQIGQLDFFFEAYRTVGETSFVERSMQSPFHFDPGEAVERSERYRQLLDFLVETIERSRTWSDAQEVLDHLEQQLGRLIECDLILVPRVDSGELVLDREERYCSSVMLHAQREDTCVLWNGEEELSPSRSAGGFGIHSVVCAPVSAGESAHAFIYAHRTSNEPFTGDDLEIARAAARVGGSVIETLSLRNRLSEQVEILEDRARGTVDFHIAGGGMRRLVEEARRVAQSSLRVLLRGATGTGKDVFARLIHAHSSRADGPFVAVNCAAIPDTLLQSELFGYARNSGIANADPAGKTGIIVRAHGGTLFLDEIGDLPLPLQAKLLRVLETGEVDPIGASDSVPVDFRLVCATHQPLESMMKEGAFRTDLYHRIRGHELTLPRLRERPEEITGLAEYFARHFFAERGIAIPEPIFTPDAQSLLTRYDWPGNVRELRNAIEGAAIQSDGASIAPRHLSLAHGSGGEEATVRGPIRSLDEMKVAHAHHVLEIAGGNKKLAAELLGIHRNTLAQLVRKRAEEDPTTRPWKSS